MESYHCLMGTEFSVGDDEKVPEIEDGDGYMTM